MDLSFPSNLNECFKHLFEIHKIFYNAYAISSQLGWKHVTQLQTQTQTTNTYDIDVNDNSFEINYVRII